MRAAVQGRDRRVVMESKQDLGGFSVAMLFVASVLAGMFLTAQMRPLSRETDPTHPKVLYVRDHLHDNKLFVCLPAVVSEENAR